MKGKVAKMRKKELATQVLITIAFAILCIAIIFPFWLLLSVSLSSERSISDLGYQLFPKNIDLSAYKYVLENPQMILKAYKVTIIFSVISMIFSVLLMAMIAYPLSNKCFKCRSGVSFYLYFTMLFGGGMVPTYVLITQYMHLDDNILVYILPGLISPWFVFMIRSFFQGIPGEIAESVLVDGGNEYTIFFKMILPLSRPVLATVALFVFLGKWNDWMTSMLYINDEKLISLQYLLQRMMQNIQLLQDNSQRIGIPIDVSKIPSETARMAMAVIVAGPALLVFPFFQKYFVKGLTVGSVKG